jgi:hypothetical protein
LEAHRYIRLQLKALNETHKTMHSKPFSHQRLWNKHGFALAFAVFFSFALNGISFGRKIDSCPREKLKINHGSSFAGCTLKKSITESLRQHTIG